ncbi:MAG: hypothetical protein H7Z74_16325 [Anaerolineae bacterium]|nr:hypothetical protein [Gemmatimonadaceae bacterium]
MSELNTSLAGVHAAIGALLATADGVGSAWKVPRAPGTVSGIACPPPPLAAARRGIDMRILGWTLTAALTGCVSVNAKPVHHYVFFGQDREKIAKASSFLETNALEGAQVAYSWRQLEPEKDAYDFRIIREDLAFLTSRGKKLFIQLQDVTFSESRINVPLYLQRDAVYNGGADKQYEFKEGDEEHAVVAGWAARRWDPAVQQRFHKLLSALGREFDGRIEGINFAETAVDFGETGRLFPKGFSFEIYRDAIITNMQALKRAFPKSVAMQYGNFMPGEWRPTNDKGYLSAVYQAAKESKVGVGGPDLLPFRPGQLKSSYPLIREAAGIVPIGIAVQDGNFEDINPTTGKRVEISELVKFATEYLNVDYVFWGTQEPYYSEDVIPFLRRVKMATLSRGALP